MFSKFFQWLSFRRKPANAVQVEHVSDVKDEALRQWRETRAQLMENNADVMAKIKEQYEASQQGGAAQHDEEGESEGLITIDRTKNMESVLRFMQLSGSPTMRKKLREAVKDKLQ